jgi:hypothetical protein
MIVDNQQKRGYVREQETPFSGRYTIQGVQQTAEAEGVGVGNVIL